jgi:hypothetical protein
MHAAAYMFREYKLAKRSIIRKCDQSVFFLIKKKERKQMVPTALEKRGKKTRVRV